MANAGSFAYWRKRTLLTVWITYGTFYLCRVNMSIAVPGIMDEFNCSKTAMGGVMTALLIAYAAGQFINGQLGDKFGARKLITPSMMVSALLFIYRSYPGQVIQGVLEGECIYKGSLRIVGMGS